jgi:ComF family protein
VLKSLLDTYKFESVRAAAGPIAEALSTCLPILPASTVVVTIPTIPGHIRQRGFDHTKLVARRLAKFKGCAHKELLRRKNNTVQFGKSARVRRAQAKEAFACSAVLDPKVPYLIIDDTCTTGATVTEAAKVLKAAGAKRVWVAVVARQSIDK